MSCNDMFKYITADEYCLKVTDGTHDSPKRVDEGRYLITSKHIKGRNINYNDAYFISEDDYNKINLRSKVDQWDVLISMIGAYCGFCYVERNNNIDYAVKNVGILKTGDKLKAEWLYYYLNSNQGKNYLDTVRAGSTQPYLSLGELRKIPIPVPENIEEMKKIVLILSVLDEKIELNNEMNKTLEEMAQALFKRWFVDFEFPNEEGKPYKSSGGEMVESELGMIPKGWDVRTLYELATYVNGTSFKNKDYSESGLPIIKIAELKEGITQSTRYFNGEKDEKFLIKDNDILFSWSGNPETSIDTFIWFRGDAILNQHIFKVIPNRSKEYYFIYLLLRYFKTTFTRIASNKQTTGLGHVTVSDLKRLKFVYDEKVIDKFSEVIKSIIDRIIINYHNNKDLIKLRDSLLPKLMSGEIRVDDIEANL